MSKPIQIVIIVLCLAAAGALFFRTFTKESTATPPATYHFQCSDPECKEEWSWVVGDATVTGLDPETCPKCGDESAIQCAKCMACGGLHPVVGHGGSQKNCPHCGASMLPQDR